MDSFVHYLSWGNKLWNLSSHLLISTVSYTRRYIVGGQLVWIVSDEDEKRLATFLTS
jgi:hypothetical protein